MLRKISLVIVALFMVIFSANNSFAEDNSKASKHIIVRPSYQYTTKTHMELHEDYKTFKCAGGFLFFIAKESHYEGVSITATQVMGFDHEIGQTVPITCEYKDIYK